MKDNKSFMVTFTGRKYYPADPSPDDICIEDIAHHLSMICRFTGATKEFYSVAEHSVLVSMLVPPEHAFAGLMHDATEAYLNDISSPLKKDLPDYRRLEIINWVAIVAKFAQLPVFLPQCVHRADRALLVTEQAALMPNSESGWTEGVTAAPSVIRGWIPHHAERVFLDRFYQLVNEEAVCY